MTVKLLYRKVAAGHSVYCLLLAWEYKDSLPGKRSGLPGSLTVRKISAASESKP